jgi:transcriptional regulator with XRE-family HTH domain
MPKKCSLGATLEKKLGDRLREERERLSLNQNEMADAGGVKRNSQGNYENGRQHPDAAYLLGAANVGVDVFYVLFGQRCLGTDQLSASETELVSLVRSMPPDDQAMVLRVVRGLIGNNSQPV